MFSYEHIACQASTFKDSGGYVILRIAQHLDIHKLNAALFFGRYAYRKFYIRQNTGV